MTKKEFSIFAVALKTYYPKDTILPNEQAMELWYMQLKDLPYEVASTALNMWVATNKWSPTIADIREKSADLVQGEQKEWSEGWERVVKCIGSYGYNRQDEALATMDEITRECVKRLGWMNICMSENLMADRANFRQMYESISERKRKYDLIPASVQEEIKKIAPIKETPVLEVHETERKGIEIREHEEIPPDIQAEIDKFLGRDKQ